MREERDTVVERESGDIRTIELFIRFAVSIRVLSFAY